MRGCADGDVFDDEPVLADERNNQNHRGHFGQNHSLAQAAFAQKLATRSIWNIQITKEIQILFL